MKPRAHTIQCLLAALLLMASAALRPSFAAPPVPQAKLETQQSVFAYPNNPSEGRDPFFPSSTRVYISNPQNQVRGPSLADLSLKTILGTPPRIFALINNHTFAAGDEGDVILKGGQRLHIRCVNIDAKAGTATVEANGLSQTMHLSEGP